MSNDWVYLNSKTGEKTHDNKKATEWFVKDRTTVYVLEEKRKGNSTKLTRRLSWVWN